MSSEKSSPPVPQKKTVPARTDGARAPNSNVGRKPQTDEDMSALGRVLLRNDFYRDGYRTMLRVAIIQGAAILALIATIFTIITVNQPENRYFATTEDGRVVPMVALSDPNLSDPAILSWAAQAATETMTFGFNDYRRRLQESSRHFTRDGWASFVKALQDSGMIEALEQKRQVISAEPRSAPTITAQGVKDGIYQWVVEMPMMITTQYGTQQASVSRNVRLTVVRVPKLESPNGVGISQWVAY